jgi:hypothetical protein
LDLDLIPEARKLPGLEQARAVALFVSSRDLNEAFTPFSGETELVILTSDEVEPVGGEAADSEEALGHGVRVIPLDVPSVIFDEDAPSDGPAEELGEALFQSQARVLGGPLWSQGDEHQGTFLLQFNDGFTSINLGDAGIMYVFLDTSFWQ